MCHLDTQGPEGRCPMAWVPSVPLRSGGLDGNDLLWVSGWGSLSTSFVRSLRRPTDTTPLGPRVGGPRVVHTMSDRVDVGSGETGTSRGFVQFSRSPSWTRSPP